MRNAFVRLMTATRDTGNFQPPERIDLILSHKKCVVFAYIVNIRDN